MASRSSGFALYLSELKEVQVVRQLSRNQYRTGGPERKLPLRCLRAGNLQPFAAVADIRLWACTAYSGLSLKAGKEA